jgi:geranylgeranyl diphosphate synthase type I
MSFSAYEDQYLALVEQEMRDLLAAREPVPGYYSMMQYHMGWLDERLAPVLGPKGKRLRPVLCLLACEAVGGQVAQALPAAAAIELVHNFSLIHDDIEDQSPTRRHRATVWKLWGEAQAINCGDGMYTVAILAMRQLQDRGIDAQRVLVSERILGETCLALTEGQYLDMRFEAEQEVDLDRYLWMIRLKSAALIACSAHLGAFLGGADAKTCSSYRQFGENLGMAFQVIDDILGIWGSEDVTGKSTATDILSRKKTLPIVYALDDGELEAIYAQETIEARDVARVVDILGRKRARDYAEHLASEFSEQAVRHLRETGTDSPAHQAIGELTQKLLGRRA